VIGVIQSARKGRAADGSSAPMSPQALLHRPGMKNRSKSPSVTQPCRTLNLLLDTDLVLPNEQEINTTSCSSKTPCSNSTSTWIVDVRVGPP